MTTEPDLTALHPLANVIAETIRATPVRLGERPDDLITQLTLKTAAYMGSELPTTPGLARHMVELDAERQRQLAKFGDQHHPDGTGLPVYQHSARRYRDYADRAAASGVLAWRDVLLEEVHEALAESDEGPLRAELVQVAAVCAAWIADLDSREPQEPATVAYRSDGLLFCTRHGRAAAGAIPLTSEDLPDGGLCTSCDLDVLIPQEA